MKKMYVLVLTALVLSSIVAGCKKDDPDPTVVGYWTGNFDTDFGFAMLFRTDGTVRVFNDSDTTAADKAEGTYIVTDSVRVTYMYGFGTFSTAAKMNAEATVMTGTWGSGGNSANGGTIYLTK